MHKLYDKPIEKAFDASNHMGILEPKNNNDKLSIM